MKSPRCLPVTWRCIQRAVQAVARKNTRLALESPCPGRGAAPGTRDTATQPRGCAHRGGLCAPCGRPSARAPALTACGFWSFSSGWTPAGRAPGAHLISEHPGHLEGNSAFPPGAGASRTFSVMRPLTVGPAELGEKPLPETQDPSAHLAPASAGREGVLGLSVTDVIPRETSHRLSYPSDTLWGGT